MALRLGKNNDNHIMRTNIKLHNRKLHTRRTNLGFWKETAQSPKYSCIQTETKEDYNTDTPTDFVTILQRMYSSF